MSEPVAVICRMGRPVWKWHRAAKRCFVELLPLGEKERGDAETDEETAAPIPESVESKTSPSQPGLVEKETSRDNSALGNTGLGRYSWRPGNP